MSKEWETRMRGMVAKMSGAPIYADDGGRREFVEPVDFPREVIQAAITLEQFFVCRGIDRWELLGVASRKRLNP